MPKGKRGGNNAHPSEFTIQRDTNHLSEVGQAKEIKPVGEAFRITPATETRVLQVAKMITEGKSKQTCLEFVQNAQGCGLQQAKYYYQAALNWLVPDDLDDYKRGLIQANVERLEKIIEECINKKDDARRGSDYLKTAKEAISELNRMLGVGSNRIQLAQNKEGDQMISIEFN